MRKPEYDSEYYTHFITLNDGIRQWFNFEDGGVTEWGMGEQCANGCAEGFEVAASGRHLECTECGEKYTIVRDAIHV